MNDQTKNGNWIGPQDALGELNRRNAMVDAISYSATRIVVGADWRAGIQELLNRLGLAAEASRVSLFEIHGGADRALAESSPHARARLLQSPAGPPGGRGQRAAATAGPSRASRR